MSGAVGPAIWGPFDTAWSELAVPCCINAGLFILRTHNDAAVPVPKASLFSRPPPFLHETGGLAGSPLQMLQWSFGCTGQDVRSVYVIQTARCCGSTLFVLNDCFAFGIILRDFSICRGYFYRYWIEDLLSPPSGPSEPTCLIFLHVHSYPCSSSSFSSDSFVMNHIDFFPQIKSCLKVAAKSRWINCIV